MPTLYHIVPKNDGYNILARGKAGNYFLISKESKGISWKGELVFKTEEEAQEYIVANGLVDYEPEKFWRIDNPLKNRHKPITTKLDILPLYVSNLLLSKSKSALSTSSIANTE